MAFDAVGADQAARVVESVKNRGDDEPREEGGLVSGIFLLNFIETILILLLSHEEEKRTPGDD